MKAMILCRNSRGRGINVGWRYGDNPQARELFWATVPDAVLLGALIVQTWQLGEPFAPPSAATVDAAASGDARALAGCVLRGELAVVDAARLVEAYPAGP